MDPNNSPEITPEILQQHPLLAAFLAVFSFAFMTAVFGTLLSWGWIARQLLMRQPVLNVRPWKPRVWGFSDLIVFGFFMVVMQVAFSSLAVNLSGIEPEKLKEEANLPLLVAAVAGLGNLAAVGLSLAWISQRFNVPLAHIGFGTAGFPRLVVIGITAGLATLPSILGLSALVNIGFSTEYEHPILDAMAEEGSVFSFGLAFFAAVIVAPIAEEFLFRVLLQGWLQSIPFSTYLAALFGANEQQRNDPNDLLYYCRTAQDLGATEAWALAGSSPPDGLDQQTEQASADKLAAAYGTKQSDTPIANDGDNPVVPPIWPSLLSGVLFGLAHWGYGLSFIPLIALGIVLGLLYRAYQSIWPCIVVHFMLNAGSMCAMGLGVYMQSVAGE